MIAIVCRGDVVWCGEATVEGDTIVTDHGNYIGAEFSAIPTTTDVTGYTYIDGAFDAPAVPAPPSRDELKARRQAKVEAIKVTTQSGKTFDGDEISQDRMARGILGLQAAGAESVTWVLADNTPIQVTATELGEALALAGAAQAAVWVIE